MNLGGDDGESAASTSKSYRPWLALAGHTQPVAALRFSPDGATLASAGADRSVRLWTPPRGPSDVQPPSSTLSPSSSSSSVPPQLPALHCAQVLEGHGQGVSDVAWSPDGAFVASASDDGTVRVWDVAAGRQACRALRGHANHVMCLHFSPNASLLASGSFDESVRLWDLRAGRCVRAIQAHSEPVTSVQFHPDGSLLASGSFDGLVRLWDPGSGQCLKTLQEEGVPPVSCLRFSPNGRFLLSSSLDARLRLWDYIAARRLKTYAGHANTSLCTGMAFVATSPHAAVACGSEDGRALLWDVQSRRVLQSLGGHSGAVVALDAHPTRRVLATAGSGGKDVAGEVLLWRDGES